VKTLLKAALAAAIVASTYYAILEIADGKADTLAGGGAFVLDERHAVEAAAFAELLTRLQAWGEADLAESLAALQGAGNILVAPRLGGGRSAVYVNVLGLVSRIYVRGDDLVVRALPFPNLDVPERAQRTFATIRLAGTLVHELQHRGGIGDEAPVYEREIAWYRGLGERNTARLDAEEGRLFDWAVASARASAEAARDKALAASRSSAPPATRTSR
jgi:hypothetical protein